MRKKILRITMLITMLILVIMPLPVGAATSGTCGDNLTWTLDGNGMLIISGTGAMEDYEFCYAPVSSSSPFDDYNIISVVIENGVTSIGNYAFYECDSLTSITIPDSVTTIGEDSFAFCESLVNITIPDSVTSIGEFSFGWCESLVNITIPDSVTSIGDMAFYDCTTLTSVTIGNGVTNISERMFMNCRALTNVVLSSSITHIGTYAFSECNSLTSITIPDSVTSIGNFAFIGCEDLTSCTIGNGVTSIGPSAFAYSGLTSIKIPPNVTTLGMYVFDYCKDLTNIEVSPLNKNYSSIDGNLFDRSKTTLIRYAIGKKDNEYTIPDGVKKIHYSAFSDCDNLISVTIPDSVTEIGYGAFSDCKTLSDVYYSSSENDWYLINIEGSNNYLTGANIHYNSDSSEIDTESSEAFYITSELVDNIIFISVNPNVVNTDSKKLHLAFYTDDRLLADISAEFTDKRLDGWTNIPEGANNYSFMLWDANNEPLALPCKGVIK